MNHDEFLAMKICQGLRPKSNYKIPQLILDIIKQCWDADPLKWPKAKELIDLLDNLCEKINVNRINYDVNSLIYNQCKEAEKINRRFSSSTPSANILSYTTHPQAIYTSRPLDFKNLPEPKNNGETEYSGDCII